MDTQKKVVIVTGAGSGIGRAVAMAYADTGAMVIIAEKDTVKGALTETEIIESGGQAVFYHVDVSDLTQTEAMMIIIKETYKKIDILINNAGVSFWKSPYEITPQEWDAVMDVNLRGLFFTAREAAKLMRETGGGSVVNIASTRALMSEPDSEAYAASKGGIAALTHALAASFSEDGIQVNCISPGWIETGDYQNLSEDAHNQHIAKRVGRPDDIARACLFLTNPENDFISGTNLVIDGGMTKKMIYY